MRVNDKIIYKGALTPYLDKTGIVTMAFTRGMCKGRYQIHFDTPILDTDGLELSDELTVAKSDVVKI